MNFIDIRQQAMIAVNTADKLIEEKSSREMSIVKTELQNAMMFAGKLIGLFNQAPHPYKKDGKREDIKDIEPMFNITGNVFDVFSRNRVQAINKFREILKELNEKIVDYTISPELNNQIPNDEKFEYNMMSYSVALKQHLDRARMWLGMELNRMRIDENELILKKLIFINNTRNVRYRIS